MGDSFAGRRPRRRHLLMAVCSLAGMVAVVPLVGAQTPGVGSTVRVSVPTGSGGQATGPTDSPPAISTDGRFVSFHSNATNLVPNDGNQAADVFVRDVQDAITYRVSVSSSGAEAAFQDTPPRSNSSLPAINANGRYVAFLSGAFNLVPNDTNGVPAAAASRDLTGRDVFVRDRQESTTTRVNVATGGAQADCGVSAGPQPPPGSLIPCGGGAASPEAPAISADGIFVAFGSAATNLFTGCPPPPPPAPTPPPRCDTNGQVDVFVNDRRTVGTTTHTTTLVNLCTALPDPDGLAPPPPAPAPPGRSCDPAKRQALGGPSDTPSISADGNVVAFRSSANNLVASDTNGISDIFVHDRRTGTTTMVSRTTTGGQACPPSAPGAPPSCPAPPGTVLGSFNPRISDDGCFVAFTSSANNLLGPGQDTNGFEDIFVRGPLFAGCPGVTGAPVPTTTRASIAAPTGAVSAVGEANGRSLIPDISSDGRYVTFESDASNLIAPGADTNNQTDVFVHDRTTLTTTRVSMPNGGGQGNAASFLSAVNGDGRLVAFASDANNLILSDTNGQADIFVNNRTAAAAIEPPATGGTDGGTPATGSIAGTAGGVASAQSEGAAPSLAAGQGQAAQAAGSATRRLLPRTGLNPVRLLALALSLLATGWVLTAGSRRRRATRP